MSKCCFPLRSLVKLFYNDLKYNINFLLLILMSWREWKIHESYKTVDDIHKKLCTKGQREILHDSVYE